MPIVEANLYGIDYFWQNRGKIIIIGYDAPKFTLTKNTEFISLGEDLTPAKWSNGLLSFFNSYDKERFILNMDDHCIVAPVKNDYINNIEQIMKDDESIDKIMLHPFSTPISLEKYSHKFKNLNLFISKHNYGSTTLMPAVWKTSYIKSILNQNLNPHEFELQDSHAINNRTLTTYNEILMVSSLINRGLLNRNWNICSYRNEFIFESPNNEYINSINNIINNIINKTQFN
jgi:hypothetical protein